MTAIRVIFTTFFVLLMLFGCSMALVSRGAQSGGLASWFRPSDNPANPPRLGNWTVDTRVQTIGVNNMNYSRESFAATEEGGLLAGLETSTTKSCFEPAIKDDADLIRTAESSFGDCDVVESDGDIYGRHAVLQCRKGAQTMRVTLDGSLNAEDGQMRISVSMSEAQSTGSTETMTARMLQSWTRSGDCA